MGRRAGRRKDLPVNHQERHLLVLGQAAVLVEDVLFKHAAVAACAVVGKPDEKWGETPVAFIELKPGVPAPAAAEIIAHCRAGLAAYKCPRHVVFGEVPKTSTGKIQKFVLRERAKGV